MMYPERPKKTRPSAAPDADELRRRLKRVIDECGIKQKLVAERLQMREVTLSAFLTGKTVSMRAPAMEKIRKLLQEVETAGRLVGTHGEPLGIQQLFQAAHAAVGAQAGAGREALLELAREQIVEILKKDAPPEEALRIMTPGRLMFYLGFILAYEEKPGEGPGS